MTDQHPITPPPELVQQWMSDLYGCSITPGKWTLRFAAHAAQWGADQEMEACFMEIIDGEGRMYIDETSDRVRLAEDLRSTRRPKPPSLKEQALAAAAEFEGFKGVDIICRALEALPDD